MPRLKPAVVVDPETGEQVLASYRTSKVAWLSEMEDSSGTVARVNNRLSSLTGMDFGSAEDLQINRYDKFAGRYEPHFDWQR